MIVDREISRRLAETANIVNEINGGAIFPTFNSLQKEDHYRLEISIPSVEPENLKIKVNNNDLLIFQNVKANGYTLPNLIGSVKILANIERDRIVAEYEDSLLVVIMPFNELPGGYQKEIEILRH